MISNDCVRVEKTTQGYIAREGEHAEWRFKDRGIFVHFVGFVYDGDPYPEQEPPQHVKDAVATVSNKEVTVK